MKISTLLIFISAFNLLAESGYSQGKDISLKIAKTNTIENVISEIEKATDYVFIYNEDVIPALKNEVNVDMSDQSLDEILDQLIKGTDLGYKLSSKQITLYKDESKKEQLQSVSSPLEIQQTSEKTISGRVTDAYGESLPGVTVVIKGTTKGTTTDVDGNFSLTGVPGNSTLQFSFVGMKMQEIPIGNQTRFDVMMEEESIGLEEFVAVGYGSMQKKHLTGAVGSVKLDDNMSFRPNSEFGQALYGQVAGVQVLNTSGRPGVSSTIQVRGVNSISADATPLVVIDGIIMPDFDLSVLNSADIASIDILKDAASSAIYGSRGANGVILVTTKSGKSGKPILTVNHSSSIQQVVRRIDVMNSAEYAQATIDAAQNGWIDSGGDINASNTIEARGDYKYTWPEPMNNPETLYDTDWHDVVFRLAPMHKTDLSLSGGDDNTSYFLSAGVLNQDGILINTDYQKYSMNLKIDSKINKWLKIGGGLNASIDQENRSGNTSAHTLTSANQYPSVYPIYGDDGYLGGPHNTPGFENHVNILFRTHHGHPYHRGGGGEILDLKRKHILANIYGEVELLPSLIFKSSFNTFLRETNQRYYRNVDTGQGPTVTRQAQNEVSSGENMSYTFLNNINYSKQWDSHQFDVVGGVEFTHREFYGISAQRRDYDNDLIPYLSAGSTIYGAGDNAFESALISVFGRVNYNFEGKYMASVSMRRDGSSRFGPNYKWGNFPSFSVGWRLSEESFLEGVDFLSNLNLRFSYGFTGNENIGDYQWISTMSQGRVAFGNTTALSYYPSSVSNPELKWEKTRQQNLGLDIGLFKDRLTLETDVYKSNSKDLLLNVPIPSTSGFSSVFQNIGEVQNIGIETKITSRNLVDALKWTSFVTFSTVKNEVVSLGPDDAPIYYSPGNAMESINKVGSPIFSYYGLKYEGVYMNQAEINSDPAAYEGVKPGNGKYKDINGDNVINSDDRVLIGDYHPDFVWAFSNSFQYKQFDLSFLFQGVIGMDVFDENIHRSWMYHEGRNYNREMLKRWRSEEEPGNGYIPKLSVNLAKFDLTPSSYFIQDGSYIRLQEVSLGYNLPSEITEKIGVSSARVYFNGTNLFLLSRATVYDPENFKSSSSDLVRRGSNFSEYPSAKVFSFGINVQF